MQPTTADGRRNILTDIKRDHEHMKGMYRQMKDSMTTDEQKQQLAWQIIHDLTVHSLAEEEVLYPAMTSVMGTETRDHALSEHKTMKDILSDLDAMTISTPGFNDKMHILMVALDHHTKEEEEEMLPEFASKVDRDMLEKMAESFEASKKRVPTRPHPAAPDKPITGNIIGNTLTAPIDKIRDMARFGGTTEEPAGHQHMS
eukprot:GHUV01005821.1.p1 GENE.GHUV01005821.1~~GHUV01005821.1.p1  ORF type:complete len:201 (+),score=65.78 GHUV01005821.1:574-1176(+)